MGNLRNTSLAFAAGLNFLLLAGCEDVGDFSLSDRLGIFQQSQDDTAPSAVRSRSTTEREVEAPDVFSTQEAALWDGRPSLGGVWVAHPDVADPERVMIRNSANGKSVAGALFRRERDNPGPRLQVSSDAAAALGIVAGAPVELNVVALRKEEIVLEEPAETAPEEDVAATAPSASTSVVEVAAATPLAASATPPEIKQTSLDPIEQAAKAIDRAPAEIVSRTSEETVRLAVMPGSDDAPAPTPSSLAKPFVQVATFTREQNARKTVERMRADNMPADVRKEETSGKEIWRVVVGPAQNSDDRAQLLAKVKEVGFTDAYPVTN